MRIAILGPYFWPQLYGIEKTMYAHAKYLAARGHEVHVVTTRLHFPDGVQNELPAFETHGSFFIRRLKVVLRAPPFLLYPSKGGFILSGLSAALKEIRPDVIHAHNIGAAAWALGGALYARKSGAAFFYSTHHHPNKLRFEAVRKSLIRAMNYLPLFTASKIYHLTSRDLEIFSTDYKYAPRDRFAVLRAGVDSPGAARTPKQGGKLLNILFVGRVDDYRKGFAILEAALEKLPEALRKLFVLSVVGTISDATRRRLESRHGGNIVVRGPVSEPELEQAYADADIFVMPSLYEGFGMPYIEAMRYGIPVIGSEAGGVPEVVPPGTGLLTPPGHVDAVAAAMAQLIADPALRSRIGAAGKDWSKTFHWESIIDGLETDYERGVEDARAKKRLHRTSRRAASD